MIQDEVWQKIQTDTRKKSFLWRLTNFAYNIYYHKTVPAKAFKPAPKVKSCLVEFQKKQNTIDLSFDNLFEFLDLHSQFSRKTLWAISKILLKQDKKTFQIPEELKNKRLEGLSRRDIEEIV
jgi:16S rRNA A1518/A1519 N6-dimethyltransferase RsmA/KsgA/DIM1 with predicted DNA glycosylase/AP lyase activity